MAAGSVRKKEDDHPSIIDIININIKTILILIIIINVITLITNSCKEREKEGG